MTEFFDVVIPEKYQSTSGEKTIWHKVGILQKNGEKMYLKLFANPTINHLVFKRKPKNELAATNQSNEVVEEEVAIEDIPF